MEALIEVIAPVFLVLGFGWLVVWRGILSDATVEGMMNFTQTIGIPVLLFRAISTIDLAQDFDLTLLVSFYTGAVAGFFAGLFGARYLFGRGWEDAVAIGFCCLFSNSLMLGLPITERAYGADALTSNFSIIAIHSPFCYLIGISAMEIARNRGGNPLVIAGSIVKAMSRNALVIGIALGFVVNLSGVVLPGVMSEALDLIGGSAIPLALFALGGVLFRYRPEGDLRTVGYVCAVSLVLHPAVVWGMGTALDLSPAQFRSAVITASVAPGVNAYVFANMYGAARRVAASAVLIGTGCAFFTVWIWLALLG